MKCKIPDCNSIICRLKEVFTAISMNSSSRSPVSSLECLLSIIETIYSSEIIIESTLDSIQIFLHSFELLRYNCLSSLTPLELFDSDISEIYTCACGSEVHSNLCKDFQYFSINIDSTNNVSDANTMAIFKRQCLSSTYKICKDPKCIYKKSKKQFCSNSSSEYIIFKVNWNQQPGKSWNSPISTSFFNKDLFQAEKIEAYSLALISVVTNEQRLIFYRQESTWYNTEDNAGISLQQMQFRVIHEKFLIEFLLYQRETKKRELFNSEVSLRVSPSDGIFPKMRAVRSKPQWVCQECHNKTSVDFKLCAKCHSIKPGETGWLCLRCETYNENYNEACISCDEESIDYTHRKSLVDFITTICPKCDARVKNGTNCQNCTRPPDVDTRLSMRNPVNGRLMASQTNCECGANLLSSQLYCLTCLVKVNSKPCPQCKSKCICKVCFDSVCKTCRSKLESGICKKCSYGSRSSKQKTSCSNCGRELETYENMNCYKCNKKSTTMTTCDNCKSDISYSLHICDLCMKKHNEPRNKNKNYK